MTDKGYITENNIIPASGSYVVAGTTYFCIAVFIYAGTIRGIGISVSSGAISGNQISNDNFIDTVTLL